MRKGPGPMSAPWIGKACGPLGIRSSERLAAGLVNGKLPHFGLRGLYGDGELTSRWQS